MTLLFEYAVRQFDPGDARHVRPDDEGLARPGGPDADAPSADDSLPIEELVSVLPNRARFLAHSDRDDWLCVPLHEPDSAALTDEYVVYEDHPVRGDVFVSLDADGDPEPLSADDFADTPLARRVRFWLPGFEPDDLPDYADHPLSREPPERSEDPDDYFDRLAAFVDAERESERERNRETASHRTPGQRAADGDSAISDIGGFSRTDENRVRFHVLAENTHGDVTDRFRIFEGNDVLLHSNDPSAAPDRLPVEATVDRIADFTIDLVLRADDADAPDAAVDALESADSLGLSLLLNDLPTGREADAVEAARSDPGLRDLLTGNRDATFACETGRRARPADPDLNERQELAATRACYADDAFCIHGPPGTGKTRTLVEVVRRAVETGERVLACADSNQAVDNLLVGASAEGHPDEGSLHYYAAVEDEFDLARHRADHSDEAFVRDNYGRHGGGDPATADVVATTNNSAAELDADFDLVVVDEATQSTVPSTLVPAVEGDRLVLAGDHRQLPPFDARTTPDEDRHHSLFEHLYAEDGGERTSGSRDSSDRQSSGVYGHRLGTMLTTQYRMHETIARFPADRFYDGALRNGRDVTPIDGLPAVVRADVSGSERTDDSHSYANPAEAEEVVSIVERLLDAGVRPENVGVVTPYEGQVHEIRGRLDREVEVDTIDSFQGGEREAIVVSFVRSNDRGDVGFLGRDPDGPRRLNVALTRAERFLALVGDWETLRESDGEDGSGTDGSESSGLYRALYDYLDAEAETDLPE
ncbi:AAA domain-containing protein [Halorussus sp. MSC15.2]|uniref:AAA domain-containing protein n=1 Tax=Halorussus sp. MSC15.2 TaxID=2283638 RepID=UPI0013D3E926|nr:AAA domain-containing protein [Halorussus sp. MSC15.2]NEU59065.1 AAA family ATPase [Halorussus sp. MSC15.2]